MYTLGPITSNCGKWRFNVERYPRPLTDAHCSCQGGEVAKLFHPISLQYENAESGSDGGRNLFFVQLRMWSFLNGWVSIWCMNPCYLELNLEFSVRGVQPVDNGWKVESKTKEQMSGRNLLLRELFNLLGVFYVGCVHKKYALCDSVLTLFASGKANKELNKFLWNTVALAVGRWDGGLL